MNKKKIIIISLVLLLIIVLLYLLTSGSIYGIYKCPDSSYKLQNKRCKKTEVVEIYNKLNCPEGYNDINGTCLKEIVEPSKVYYSCEEGYNLENQSCTKTIIIDKVIAYSCIRGKISKTDESKCLIYSEPSVQTVGTKKEKYCTKEQGVLDGDNCIKTEDANKRLTCPAGYSREGKNKCKKVDLKSAQINRTCETGYNLEGIKCVYRDTKEGSREETCLMGYTMKDNKCYKNIDVVATKVSIFKK